MDAASARAFYAEQRWGNLWGIKGPLYDPVTGHKGLDIQNPGRALVPALRAGRVTSIYRHPVIGWVVAIEHARGDVDGYCHIIQPLVRVGDVVDRFDPIARLATWGDFTGTAWGGPHLHLVNAATVSAIHMGPTRDPAPIIRAQLFDFAGGGTPIQSEEDDMTTTLELVKTPDDTVWWCVDRVTRYAIPGGPQLATYQAHLKNLGLPTAIVEKSHAEIKAYGAPVYDNGIARIAAAVDGVVADEEIQAALAAGGAGGSSPLDLAPLLDQLKRLPADVISELKTRL